VYDLRSQEDWRRRQRSAGLTAHLDASDSAAPPSWTSDVHHDATWLTDRDAFEVVVNTVAGEQIGQEKTLKVYGRPLHIPWQIEGQVARFKFKDLCEKV
jgi:predicted ATPase